MTTSAARAGYRRGAGANSRSRRNTTGQKGIAMSEEPKPSGVLDLLSKMTADSLEACTLDDQTLMMVRIAALVAVDAAPASYMMNVAVADSAGVSTEQVQGVMAAVAPIVGTARIVSATGNIVKALGLALEMAEIAELEEEAESDPGL
jgi:alkylhydroperoxidase/carboxymuconolactone decarboxylase family protein YurZ